MGVDIRVRGRMVELRGFGVIAGRESLHWAEVVRETAAVCRSRVYVLCEFERGMEFPHRRLCGGLPRIAERSIRSLVDWRSSRRKGSCAPWRECRSQ